MLELAHPGLHVAQMTSRHGIRACFDVVMMNAAKVMRLEGYGLVPGCDAQLCAAAGARCGGGDSINGEPAEGVAQGVLVAETPEVVARLKAAGQPNEAGFSRS